VARFEARSEGFQPRKPSQLGYEYTVFSMEVPTSLADERLAIGVGRLWITQRTWLQAFLASLRLGNRADIVQVGARVGVKVLSADAQIYGRSTAQSKPLVASCNKVDADRRQAHPGNKKNSAGNKTGLPEYPVPAGILVAGNALVHCVTRAVFPASLILHGGLRGQAKQDKRTPQQQQTKNKE
jgi:hypothetical protein